MLDGKTKIKVGDISDDEAVIAVREFKKYSEAEE